MPIKVDNELPAHKALENENILFLSNLKLDDIKFQEISQILFTKIIFI